MSKTVSITAVPTNADLGPQDCCAGEPINLTTGNTYIQEADIAIPGLNGGLKLVRTWNSMLPTTPVLGGFGIGWTNNFEERIDTEDGGYANYSRGDGSVWTFQIDSSNLSNTRYISIFPGTERAALQSGSLLWTLTFKSGERRFFNKLSGSLTAMQDRNGNTTSITYDGLNRISNISDPTSRHLYFHYGNSIYLQQVTSVMSDAGIITYYQYDQNGNLVQVAYPDSSSINFEYDSDALITAVRDKDGKLLETHTYDSFRRGLSSARAIGVDGLTVVYPTQ